MKKGLDETYNFLKLASFLWDRHFQRMQNAQIVVLQDLAIAVEKSGRSADVTNSKVALDSFVLHLIPLFL